MSSKKEMVSLNGDNLVKKEKISDSLVMEHISVPGNKILLRVLRKVKSTILTVDSDAFEFEAYFPVLAVGENVKSVKVGDYVATTPGTKLGVTKLFGDEFVICDTYLVDHIVSEYYAKIHDKFKDSDSVYKMAEELKKDTKLHTKPVEDKALSPAILGDWKNKSTIN